MLENEGLPPLLLIHGAWQGSWVWARLLPELAAAGLEAHVIDLPGNGWGPQADAEASLERYVEQVLVIMAKVGNPVVLLGHSGGGITVSQVAEAAPEQVAALVYLAGMMLPDGQTYADFVSGEVAALESVQGGIGPHLQWSEDHRTSTVPAAAARAVFLHDADEATAGWAAERLRRQHESGRAMAPSVTKTRYGSVPRLYIEAVDDRSVPIQMQRKMQALQPGTQRLSLDCGHVPQLVKPRETATALDAGLRRLLAEARDGRC